MNLIIFTALIKIFNFIFLLFFNIICKIFSHKARILNMSFTLNILLRTTIAHNIIPRQHNIEIYFLRFLYITLLFVDRSEFTLLNFKNQIASSGKVLIILYIPREFSFSYLSVFYIGQS